MRGDNVTLKAKFHYAIQVADLVADLVSDLSQTGMGMRMYTGSQVVCDLVASWSLATSLRPCRSPGLPPSRRPGMNHCATYLGQRSFTSATWIA